ncbi:E3 ubiquitin-protein ligase RNF4 isoform X4 [Hippocampus comes]|uniref:E3 ubiquitin-protein ligase RNF4 isoform X4 n=1 Tax=Hippocampus comes TaxID=109280 RepID=UPI00094ED7C2|nr:PREDICTED: E3 ubiquitin-protein ligase RNF4 isoform X4 [Hippocampus comes]
MSASDVPAESVRPPSSLRRRAETTKRSGAPTRAAQRKRMSVGSLLASGCPKPRGRAHARRVVHANTRANASRVARRRASPPDVPAPAAGETIDVMDNLEDGVEEVVDLTSEAAEASHVVDLTSSDSVLLVDEGSPSRRNASGESYVVSSDDDEASPPVPGADVLSSLQTRRSSSHSPEEDCVCLVHMPPPQSKPVKCSSWPLGGVQRHFKTACELQPFHMCLKKRCKSPGWRLVPGSRWTK